MIVPVLDCGIVAMPKYETENSAGLDLRYNGEDVVLFPNDRKLFPTGMHMAIPKGYVGLVCPRSGLALKDGLTVLNAPGIIDADYRGDVGVILINLGTKAKLIKNGDRVAQLVIVPYANDAQLTEVESLDETERGEGAFGHTGTN